MNNTSHKKSWYTGGLQIHVTYLKKKNINEAIHQNLMNKDVYELDMHKIYNITVDQVDEQLQEKAASDATFQAFKTDFRSISY